MGIKNFRKFITSKIENFVYKIKFNDLNIKSVCIDINIFIYKFITAIRRTGKDLEHNGEITSHIIGLRNQINLFEKLGIEIIYVFDGSPPKEKTKILKEREIIKKTAEKEYQRSKSIKSYQQSFFITNDILESAKEYIKLRGIKYIDIDLEADIICAGLVKQKIVDCVYTTDFDVLVYGARCMIINIDYQKKYFEYILLKDILNGLDLSYEQFVDMIVLSGCDYCDKTENMTLNKAYKEINENTSIKLSKTAKKAKDIFMLNIKVKKKSIVVNNYNEKGLKKFLGKRGLKS